MLMRCLLESNSFNSGGGTIPVKAERKPKSLRSGTSWIPDFPWYKDSFTSSSEVPIQEYIPIPVMTTLLSIFMYLLGINPSVYIDDFTRNVAGFSRSKEADQIGNLIGFAKTIHGNHSCQFLFV